MLRLAMHIDIPQHMREACPVIQLAWFSEAESTKYKGSPDFLGAGDPFAKTYSSLQLIMGAPTSLA